MTGHRVFVESHPIKPETWNLMIDDHYVTKLTRAEAEVLLASGAATIGHGRAPENAAEVRIPDGWRLTTLDRVPIGGTYSTNGWEPEGTARRRPRNPANPDATIVLYRAEGKPPAVERPWPVDLRAENGTHAVTIPSRRKANWLRWNERTQAYAVSGNIGLAATFSEEDAAFVAANTHGAVAIPLAARPAPVTAAPVEPWCRHCNDQPGGCDYCGMAAHSQHGPVTAAPTEEWCPGSRQVCGDAAAGSGVCPSCGAVVSVDWDDQAARHPARPADPEEPET